MTDPSGRSWSHHLVQLRARAAKLKPGVTETAVGRLIDDALATCAELLDGCGRLQLKCDRLHDETQTVITAQTRLFESVPCPSVITDRRGTILQANTAAGRLFNLASRRLAGRELLLYSQHRDAFLRFLSDLPRGDRVVSAPLIIRPRERRPTETAVTVTAVPPEQSGMWIWFFAAPNTLPILMSSIDADDMNVDVGAPSDAPPQPAAARELMGSFRPPQA